MRRKPWQVLLAALLLFACGDDDDVAPEEPRNPVRAELPEPQLRLLVLTDLDGTLEPCGCTSRPLGGIDRLAARVRELAQGAPSVFVAAGDLFLGHEGHAGPEGEDQEVWRAETLAAVLGDLGLAAATPGPRDLRLGVPAFRALEGQATFPLLAAGVTLPRADAGPGTPAAIRADGDDPASPEPAGAETPELPAAAQPLQGGRLVTVGELKIGLVGVSELGPDAEATEPLEAARAAVAELREAGAQLVVALGRLDRRALRQLAGVDGVDFVVRAGFDQEDVLPPTAAGDGFLLHAGRQGQHLLVVDLYRPGAEGEWADVSRWSVDEARRRLEGDIAELRERMGESEGGDGEGRLRALEGELETLRDPVLPERGPAFAARVVELDPETPRDGAVREVLDRLDIRINDHNREAYADRAPPPLAEGQPDYVGSVRCQSCHRAAYTWWRAHPHGRAYETLTSRHKEFHLECVGCHVTGYELPGGSTVTHNDDGALVDVGCEVCHGPGGQHVQSPHAANIRRDPNERLCVGCHNEEHSDLFVYDAYRATLLVPGHGRPQ